MSQTVSTKILRRMMGSKGSVWTAKDLMDLGTRASIDQALRRLSLQGTIRKVARGLYDYPQSSSLIGRRSPTVHAVAKAAARARGAQLRPSGAVAASALGLSTQVPERARPTVCDALATHLASVGVRLAVRLPVVVPNDAP